jgi:hypothetical protein
VSISNEGKRGKVYPSIDQSTPISAIGGWSICIMNVKVMISKFRSVLYTCYTISKRTVVLKMK